MARSGYVKMIYFPIAILGLLVAYTTFSSLTANADIPASNQEGQVKDITSHDKEGESFSTTAEVGLPQATQDGKTIINKRCTPCHMNTSFEQMDKTPSEWEKTLALMEVMGLQLSQDEKSLLLEYLSEP